MKQKKEEKVLQHWCCEGLQNRAADVSFSHCLVALKEKSRKVSSVGASPIVWRLLDWNYHFYVRARAEQVAHGSGGSTFRSDLLDL